MNLNPTEERSIRTKHEEYKDLQKKAALLCYVFINMKTSTIGQVVDVIVYLNDIIEQQKKKYG